jgi:hypothetical protein
MVERTLIEWLAELSHNVRGSVQPKQPSILVETCLPMG